MKVSCVVTVTNVLGLHARPATFIAKLLKHVKSSVYFTCKEQRVDARSAMNLLLLMATQNSEILVEAEGEDAEEICGLILHAFEKEFKE